jgi:outer membrane murein-binding lipoprotein Lpp
MEVYSMKKMVLLTAILMLILGLAGCSKEEKSIDADEVSTNTLLAKSNGELQIGRASCRERV